MAWGSGLFHDDEIREPLADLAHITLEHSAPPEGFIYPNNQKALEQASALKQDEIKAAGEVKADGSTAQSNGVGRDSSGVGPKSKTVSASSQRSKAAK
jgi:hypothetical protein